MHELLKSMLLDTEVIWIYDEPNKIAVVQQVFKNGRTLFCAMVYFTSISEWVCIDIQQTDIHGAQRMYDCMVKACKRNLRCK